MDGLWQDLKFGVRSLAKHPGLTLVAVATLALGIGANTAIFSVVSAVLLRPLPYADEDHIVALFEKRPKENAWTNRVSPADFLDWRRQTTMFEGVAALEPVTSDLVSDGEPERIQTGQVSASFFDVLGVKPRLGRLFRDQDETEAGAKVAVLSHGLWQRRFGGAEDAVGRSIDLSGVPTPSSECCPRSSGSRKRPWSCGCRSTSRPAWPRSARSISSRWWPG